MTEYTDEGPRDDTVSLDESEDSESRRDRDGVASLRDTSEEVGDEEEVTDGFELDELEAREVGGEFEGGVSDEPRLD